ncbi:HAMP domain-containing histidine kinase [Candidatus Nomurabacteria bacterium]|nr:HAMP domain-containing histidine kinase [Candidatus Kaiserbacteria bacterium]MCB9813976.1 HAMP domain-containing histidine kinase [Candidatus Nomurabacteria bacterium]
MNCYLYPEPSLFFFTYDLPGLLYYSHIPTTIVALLVGFFVFLNARHLLLNRLLLLIAVCFSSYTFISLIAWTNVHGDLILFLWPLFGILQAFISIFSIYFIYVFLTKEDVKNKIKLVFIALLTPVLLLAHTDLNVSGFNITYCDSFGYEGVPFKIYYTSLGVLAMIWILWLLVTHHKTAENNFKKQIVLMGTGIEFFLFSFFTTSFISTYLAGIGVLHNSSLEFYGMLGMMVFMMFIGILMVRFKTFHVGMVSSQALAIALIVLVGSQFTFADNTTSVVLTSITLIIVGVFSILLIRSVRKEIKQREQIEHLAGSLEKANARLKALDKQKSEFVSIASHQLRSPITAIRGYASLLLEGSYGDMPEKAMEPLDRIEESSKLMALAIEDYLNVSRIESGNMKYNLSDFNLRNEVEHVCDDLRGEALKQGLVLLFRTDLNSAGVVNADIGKTVQAVQNLILNSIKYTKKGTIKVIVRDIIVRKRIYVDIIDTGIGMNQETLNTIFQKFERAENANTANVHGTGLGLFVSLSMIQAMGGTITAHSEGDGKGSRFTLELPLAM